MTDSLILSILADGAFAAVAATGFAVISNPPKKAILIAAGLAAVGHALRFYLLHNTVLDITTASLAAAFAIGLISMLAAKLIHCPAEVFSFPSLLPMVPGMYAYKTVLATIRFMSSHGTGDPQELIVQICQNGLTTIFVMFALVIGVSLPMFIFHKQSFMMTRLLNNKRPA
ncbi:MAG: threonine/serine exporter family protein [Rikenellaceae bacterium]|nr:threonine/serine exporter family protein [Rikenellaceae bacterium]